MESPCEYGIEPPGSISHGIRQFYIEQDLRQDDPLACPLFNINVEKMIRNAKVERKAVMFYKTVQVCHMWMTSFLNQIDK